jgi:hypothetical protein
MDFHIGVVQVRQQPLQAHAVRAGTRIQQGHLTACMVGHAQRIEQFLFGAACADGHAGAGIYRTVHQRFQYKRRQRLGGADQGTGCFRAADDEDRHGSAPVGKRRRRGGHTMRVPPITSPWRATPPHVNSP